MSHSIPNPSAVENAMKDTVSRAPHFSHLLLPLLLMVAASALAQEASDLETPSTLTFSGHSGPVNCAVYLPGGHQIISGSGDGLAKIWDARSGSEVINLSGHTEAVL